MALVLVGRVKSDSPSREDPKRRIIGVNLHCIQDVVDPEQGQTVERLYVYETKAGYKKAFTIPFGSFVTPVYNRFGKVEDIIWTEPEAPKK